MKINHQHPNLARQTQIESRQETQKVPGTQGGKQQDTGPASVTHLSQAATDASQDIDGARVEEIREAIRDGKLDIRAERIADGLIASVQDLLDQENGKP
ncbi:MULTISPECIES: flagellar biosynthesis anti-sigma factor FlgM [unclassified Halomonas]|uniref:flagellar biosynthesis anti-sigma factor FlgM n=1 Tax=unclassified Halomonas TaxID=2609666 RepID=UPI002886B47E|nr:MULTISPECIES: flagellar biosynthesis anti-sigma factor FlgM [unclassified Halomonas]MDT0500524.1 flagellar biosynthesis anti-sigma factor FlgM [Halomonas sp. PAR7]MDT0590132.1 flagellar biosynthesis anti-sigma factor FlgM [Halomonas sp. PAR8]